MRPGTILRVVEINESEIGIDEQDALVKLEELRKLHPRLLIVEPAPNPLPRDNFDAQIRSVKEAAIISGLGLRTFKRLLANGVGPPLVQLTSKRVGILNGDLERWLRSRRREA
jgi:hypothetical protein